jgi:Uma2 family endonuclease
MATQRGVFTYEDYAALPDDGRRYEVHEGALSVTPSPGVPHQEVSANLGDLLRGHVKQRALGTILYAPLDVILSDVTIVQPDLVYVDQARAGIITRRAIEGAPTLAVEIISPSSPRIDRVTKRELYQQYRVPYYWIVDPDARSIEAYELAENAYRLVAIASGAEPIALPPFHDLAIVPDSLWPALT